MTVKIYYLDGTHYTINGGYVYSGVNWDSSGTTILDSNGDIICKVPTPMLEILYIEERDPECGTVIIRHPTVRPMSVNVDVMTAKQRSKANQSRWDVEHMKAIELSVTGAGRFFELLDNPPPVNEKTSGCGTEVQEWELSMSELSQSELYSINKYYSLVEGIKEVCPDLLKTDYKLEDLCYQVEHYNKRLEEHLNSLVDYDVE